MDTITRDHPCARVLTLAHLCMPTIAVLALGSLMAHHLGHALLMPEFLAIGSGTLSAYILDRVVDGRDESKVRSSRRSALRLTMVPMLAISALMMVSAIILSASAVLPGIMVLGLLCVAYPWAKAVPGLKTMIVASAWTLAIALVGSVSMNRGPFTCLAIFLIIAGSAILCDLKDGQQDRKTGVYSIVVLFGEAPALLMAMTLCLGGVLVALIDHAPWIAITGLAQLLVVPCRRLLIHPVRGPLLVDALLACCPMVGLLANALQGRT